VYKHKAELFQWWCHANNQAKCVCYTVELPSKTFMMNVSRLAALLHFIVLPLVSEFPPA